MQDSSTYSTQATGGSNFPLATTERKGMSPRKFLIALVAILLLGALAAPISSADAQLYPMFKTNIHNTQTLRAALKSSPVALAILAKNTGGGNPSPKDFTYCGQVNSAQRTQLVQQGYKNTAVDGQGDPYRLGTLKPGPLSWACRVNTKVVEQQLKKQLGSGVKLHCYTHTYKAGSVTVRCEGAKRTYKIKPPQWKAPIGSDCTNSQDKGNATTTETTISNMWTAWSTILVKKGETITCPGGASATATATALARGFGYGNTLAAAKAMAKKNAYAKVTVNGHCGVISPPVVTEQPPTQTQNPVLSCPTGYAMNSQGVCVQIVVGCPDGQVKDSNGVCSPQTNTAELKCEAKGGTYDSVTLTCTIIQVNGICSYIVVINGDGNVISNSPVDVNCGTQTPPPPPTCPPGTTGIYPNCQTPPPPPPVDHAPQISCVFPAHVYVGGNVYIWCEASDPDGDALSVNVVGNSSGHISGTIPSDVRWDGTPCPSGVSCYRSSFWGDTVGTANVTATVSANGLSANSVGQFPVLADSGF